MDLYQAMQQSLKRFVLLKILFLRNLSIRSDQLMEEFREYVNQTARLENLHLQPIYHLGVIDEDHFYVAGKVMAGNLRTLLLAGALPPERTLELALQTIVAMVYVNSRGLIHSSLSPRTVYLNEAAMRTSMILNCRALCSRWIHCKN